MVIECIISIRNYYIDLIALYIPLLLSLSLLIYFECMNVCEYYIQ
nr:MAG TPA: hypothetical protein [Caudoviricetes sp.]